MIKTVCVCGAGTMGSGIAQIIAQSGFSTIQYDLSVEMLEKSSALIQTNLQALVGKKRLTTEAKDATLNTLRFTNNITDCKADLVIEAIIEKIDAKVSLLNQLAAINTSDTILATNTSSISITLIGNQVEHSSRVVGLHFFNPAPVMKLVEVVKGEATTEDVIERVRAFSKQLGKTPVICKDAPGFIVNRVARHYYLEAMRLVELGLTDVESVDELMQATGFKMGPFKLMDLIGMDVNYSVSNIVWEALGKPERLTPSNLQKQKVDANELGKKTGKGFYNY